MKSSTAASGDAMTIRKIKVGKIGSDPTVVYAAEELRKYLKKIDPGLAVDILKYENWDLHLQGVLWVGLDNGLAGRLPEVADTYLDDAILVEVEAGRGVVTGTNPRSVLFAVYRLLKELGCGWVRPGEEGEIIPKRVLEDISVAVKEKASYRHRAVCIEGSNSCEHIREFIGWMPKMNLNGYFIQFLVPSAFFDRWYSHGVNPGLKSEKKLTRDDARRIKAQMIEDMQLRGLLFHDVGHGWTCESLGLEGASWETDGVYEIEDKAHMFAQLRGVRGLHRNIPLNTQLCYSMPEVREIMASAVAEYCEGHPEVDYLHFWLADGQNNHCECENCQDTRPSDFYVMMMNLLDEKLTRRGIDTKIVFGCDLDKFWAPEKEVIQNEDRFVLQFAPFTRTFEKSLAEISLAEPAELPPYTRNTLKFPKTLKDNVAMLADWKKRFSGDSFDFDYHLMWDHYCDPGYYRCAQVLYEDMKNLDKVGLNGMMSCQTHRSFFPSGLPAHLMAGVLWDKSLEFQAEAEKFHRAAFGDEGLAVLDYLRQLSEAFRPDYIRDFTGKESIDPGHYAIIGEIVTKFAPSIERNSTRTALLPNQNRSWEYLKYHAQGCLMLAEVAEARLAEDSEKMAEHWKRIENYYAEHELELQNVFDLFEFIYSLKRYHFAKSDFALV